MILCPTLSLIRHLICGNSYSWFLNLNLIYKILQTGAGSGLLISVLEKLVAGAIDVKMDGFEEKPSFQILGFSFSSELGCGSYIVSAFKTVFEKIGVLIYSIKFFSPVLYLYKSTIWLYVEYCCHVGVGAPSRYMDLLDKLQKPIFRTVGPLFAAFLKPLGHL